MMLFILAGIGSVGLAITAIVTGQPPVDVNTALILSYCNYICYTLEKGGGK
jgi:hypothetical protein